MWIIHGNDDMSSPVNELDKRRLIIEAATELIIQKGIDSTSLADIADKAQISKGTLYYYYSSKNDLIFDVAEGHIDDITRRLTQLVDDSANQMEREDLLKIVFRAVLGADLRNKLHIYLVKQAISGDAALQERFRVKYAEWKQILKERVGRIVPDSDADLISSMIVALLDGLVMQSVLGSTDIRVDDFASYMVRCAS